MTRILTLLGLILCATVRAGSLYPGLPLYPGQALPPAAAAAKATATDTFDRTDVNPISNPMSDGVGIWISGPGAYNGVRIFGNRWLSTDDTSGSMVGYPNFSANQSVQAIPISKFGCGLSVRMQGTNTSNSYLLYVLSSTSLGWFRITGDSTSTQIGTNMVISTLLSTDTLKCTVSGIDADTTLTAYVNGVVVGIQKDTNSSGWYNTGQPGLYGNSSKYIDDFYATDL